MMDHWRLTGFEILQGRQWSIYCLSGVSAMLTRTPRSKFHPGWIIILQSDIPL
jgi:hypothetical protein